MKTYTTCLLNIARISFLLLLLLAATGLADTNVGDPCPNKKSQAQMEADCDAYSADDCAWVDGACIYNGAPVAPPFDSTL